MRGSTCSFFLEKKKEPKKNRSGFLPIGLRVFALWGTVSLYGRRRIYSDLSCLVRYEPAALTYALFCRSPCTVILSVSGYRAPGFGFLRCFSPAVCSPLRRLRAYSAELVRAPPYIKVERENCPPAAIRWYSHRCIGRARHKPERARQLRRIYRASVRASSILGERRLSARGGMQPCCGVPDSEFRIPNSASPFPAQRTISSLSPIINSIEVTRFWITPTI